MEIKMLLGYLIGIVSILGYRWAKEKLTDFKPVKKYVRKQIDEYMTEVLKNN